MNQYMHYITDYQILLPRIGQVNFAKTRVYEGEQERELGDTNQCNPRPDIIILKKTR